MNFAQMKAKFKTTLTALGHSNNQWSEVTCDSFGGITVSVQGSGNRLDVVPLDTDPFPNDDSINSLVSSSVLFAYNTALNEFLAQGSLQATEVVSGFLANAIAPAQTVASLNLQYDATQSKFQAEAYARAANIFKSVEVTASGNTTIWTPTSGKKFVLLGGEISGSGTAASLVANLLKLQDGAGGTNIKQWRIAINTTVTGDTQIAFFCGLNGYVSAAENNVLNANLATAMATGSIVVNTYGVEI